ncbi:MAG: spore coat protein [Lachnotalea sp.]
MILTQKETTLLKDLKSQEQLCVDKYDRYSSEACNGCLKEIFTSLKQTEQQHLKTVNEILGGSTPNSSESGNSQKSNTSWNDSDVQSYNDQDKKRDTYLCSDALAGEKHVSSVYNTSIFEFKDAQVRDALNHIQKEEQKHGERIWNYMESNGMYEQ